MTDIARAIYSDKRESLEAELRALASKLTILVMILAVLIVAIWNDVIVALLGAEFGDSRVLVTLLLLGQVVNVATGMCGNVLAMSGFERKNLMASAWAGRSHARRRRGLRLCVRTGRPCRGVCLRDGIDVLVARHPDQTDERDLGTRKHPSSDPYVRWRRRAQRAGLNRRSSVPQRGRSCRPVQGFCRWLIDLTPDPCTTIPGQRQAYLRRDQCSLLAVGDSWESLGWHSTRAVRELLMNRSERDARPTRGGPGTLLAISPSRVLHGRRW